MAHRVLPPLVLPILSILTMSMKSSLVPSLSARQIFIAYSMKNLTRGKAGYEAT